VGSVRDTGSRPSNKRLGSKRNFLFGGQSSQIAAYGFAAPVFHSFFERYGTVTDRTQVWWILEAVCSSGLLDLAFECIHTQIKQLRRFYGQLTCRGH
jgi:hypothetical protein